MLLLCGPQHAGADSLLQEVMTWIAEYDKDMAERDRQLKLAQVQEQARCNTTPIIIQEALIIYETFSCR